jgi:DNA-binding response OmpR family regulator
MTRILLTHDNSDYRHALLDLLRAQDYDVIEAADGATALTMARAGGIDAIICDIDLPDMDGFAVLAAVRGDTPIAATPVLLVVDQADAAALRRGDELGVSGYLLKPMNPGVLLHTINQFIRRG